jgi:hypothetical protein
MKKQWMPSQVFADIARGDESAAQFMGVLYCWFHKQDDLFDGDHLVSAEVSAGFDLSLLHALAKNSFFQKNQDYLWPVITMSAIAWVASEERARTEDVLERITAQVLKSQYQDIFFAVAFCIGKFDHAVAMSRKYRDYCFDNELPSAAPSLGKKETK